MNEERRLRLERIKVSQIKRTPNLSMDDAREKLAYSSMLYEDSCIEIERLNKVISMINPSNKAIVIKYANGEAQIMTLEHAETEDGKKALEFAKSSGEDVLILDLDDAVDLIVGICQKEKNTVFN